MSEVIKEIELKKICPNRLNPRLDINIERLNELAESIKNVGLLEPIIVRPYEEGYEVVVGERRYRASQQANLEKVPAIIREYTDNEVVELNLIENIQREELNAIEKGNCCKELLEKYPDKYPTSKKLAEKIGVTDASIYSWLELVSAPKEIQKIVIPVERGRTRERGKIDYDTAVTITRRIKEPERQVKLAKEIAKRPIYGRKARQIITKVAKEPEKPVEEIVKEIVEAPYEMPFRLNHKQPILQGLKVQTSRTGIDPKVKVGALIHAAVWEPHFADLRVTYVERKRLKYFDEEDAEREGGYTLEEFKKVWKEIHGDWNENQFVYVIHFEKVK